jgi:hypothetical protein
LGKNLQALLTGACLFFFVKTAHSQEALRTSLAGETTRQSQSQAAITLGYYNLLTGPVSWRFLSGLELSYNDNVNYSQNNREGDFIFQPNLATQARWPVTENNILNFSLNAGYSAYVQHPNLSRFYINPGSDLSFDILIGDLTINLHERPSITENAYENPTSGGQGNYSLLQNTVGTTATWDLDRWVLQGNYDHINYVYLNDNQQFPNGTSDNLLFSAGARFASQFVAGVEGGGSLINYDQSSTAPEPNATQWNAGVFCKAPISDYMNARVDVGYTDLSPENSDSTANVNGVSTVYFQFSLLHQVNQYINYSLTAGHSVDLELNGQPYEYYFVQLQPNWNFLKNYQLSTPLSWRQGTEVYNQTVDFDQYQVGINLTRTITQKLSGTLGYQFIKETSDTSSFNYIANIVSLSFTYQF